MKDKRLVDIFAPIFMVTSGLFIWQIIVSLKSIPMYILPKPTDILNAFILDFSIIKSHTLTTVLESGVGFFIAVIISIILVVIMDFIPLIKKALYPVLIISQTIPVVSLAPLFIIWFGFGIMPKIIVVVLVCFFPIVISLSEGLDNIDTDYVNHFKLMGSSKINTFFHLKIPFAMINLFSGLKISATYCIMGAIIGEWLGGSKGLGVYMTRARSTYSLDKMFAAILAVIVLSISLFFIIDILENILMPWRRLK